MLGLSLPNMIALAITLVIAITVHEFAHAYAADRLGDPTPRMQGRLVLDPRVHLDPIGSLAFILVGFGWGRPVFTNPYNLRVNGSMRLGMAIVAAAGPFSNLILALLGAIPIRLGLASLIDFPGIPGITPSLSEVMQTFVLANLGLLLFNLLPIAPLDGFKVAVGTLPYEWSDGLARLEPYGPMILMLILASGWFGLDILGPIIRPPLFGLYGLITGL